jgi:hypothetical protein
MTPTLEQINVALAKWAGWKVDDELEDGALMGHIKREGSEFLAWDVVPDYTTSLDAIHRDLESRLTDEQWIDYGIYLSKEVFLEGQRIIHNDRESIGFMVGVIAYATAEQKARALFTALQLEVI